MQTCHMRKEVPRVMVWGTLFLPIGDVNYCFRTGLEICISLSALSDVGTYTFVLIITLRKKSCRR